MSLAFFTASSGKVARCDGFFRVQLPLQQKSRLQRAHQPCNIPDLLTPVDLYDCHRAITKLTKRVDEQEAELQQDYVQRRFGVAGNP